MKQGAIHLLLLLVLILNVTPVIADTPPNFKEVMQHIEVDMSKLVGHMMKEEYTSIAIIAERVANHDEPPLAQRLKIIAELGTDFLDFKRHDDNVHMNSVAMQEAAQRKNLDAVIISYGKTLESCNGCHKKYRERFRKLKL